MPVPICEVATAPALPVETKGCYLDARRTTLRRNRTMRASFVVTLIAFFCSQSPAAGQFGRWEEPAFNLEDCCVNATHILVVDARGCVLEIWKGNATQGDMIPIERFRSSFLARLQFVDTTKPLPD